MGKSRESPAEVVHDGAVDGLILTAARISQHIVIVSIMVHVLVLRDQVDVQHADMDSQS